jgi:acetylornithine deacetylase/succinyl-diaminopimelate desuccinylase-like protein
LAAPRAGSYSPAVFPLPPEPELPQSQSSPLGEVLAHLDAQADGAVGRLQDIIRIPSVSADPARRDDCRRAAEWVAGELAALGFAVGLRDTGGQPAVVGHHPGPPDGGGRPRALFYSHYDVQPADPVGLWHSDPFEPLLTEGPHGRRLFARGASDNKGQLVSWIEALRAFVAVTGGLPLPVSVLVEGEEEVGSPNLRPFVAAHRDELAADVALANDASMWAIDTPALVTRLRGMLYTQLDIRAAAQDLHSGLYGGLVVNPLDLLAGILAALHDGERKVAIPGFYDGVEEVADAERARLGALGFDTAGYLADVGLAHPFGEAGRSTLERIWTRPTAEVNGIWGGYAGPGSKTVIPAEAHAKVSFRLVPGQDPAAVAEAFRRFVAARLPPDARAEVTVISASPATIVPADSPYVALAAEALGAEFGRPAVLAGSGGTLPVMGAFAALGIPALLYGWAQNDDNPHSPNEKFELSAFAKGMRCHARLLAGLAAHRLPRTA